MGSFHFALRLGNEDVEFSGDLPEPGSPASAMVPVYLGIGGELLDASLRESSREGELASCGPHCGACCRQLVPISKPEADYLRKAVIPHLPEDHRQRVEQRISQAREKIETAGLAGELENLPMEKDRENRQKAGLRYFLLGIPCPFLEDESCSIHPQRPLSCREYLVTSPASRCSSPAAGSISMLATRVKPSAALIRADHQATGVPGWCTMISALTADHLPEERTVSDPEAELMGFLSHLSPADQS